MKEKILLIVLIAINVFTLFRFNKLKEQNIAINLACNQDVTKDEELTCVF